MARGIRLWEFPLADHGVLFLTTVGYLALGYLVFRACVRRARREGFFGQY